MRLSPLDKSTSFLLTLSLLANSVGWQIFRHAHTGGDEPHSHAADGCKTHESGTHRHFHRHHHSAKDPDDCDGQLATSSVHIHAMVFGFSLSVPASDESQGDGDHDDGKPEALTFLGLDGDITILPTDRSVEINSLRTHILYSGVRELIAAWTTTAFHLR